MKLNRPLENYAKILEVTKLTKVKESFKVFTMLTSLLPAPLNKVYDRDDEKSVVKGM